MSSLTKRTKAQQHNYEVGYRHGMRGLPRNEANEKTYPGYADGWDDGNCDRPTLEERMPIDARKEATAWWT